MPRLKRRAPKVRRTAITGSHIGQLARGNDFFGDAFGNGSAFDIDAARAAWQDPAVRELVYDRQRRHHNATPFAEHLFGVDGKKLAVLADVPFAMEAYRRGRDAARTNSKIAMEQQK